MAATVTQNTNRRNEGFRQPVMLGGASPRFGDRVNATTAAENAPVDVVGQRLPLPAQSGLPIRVVYLLTALENGLRLAQPLVIGLAINDLLGASYRGLLLFAAQHLAYMVIGAARQMYAARVFGRTFVSLLPSEPEDSNPQDVSPSGQAVVAPHRLADVEQTIPLLIRSVVLVVGALLMLALYDVRLVPICMLFLLPFTLLQAAYGRPMWRLISRLRDADERTEHILAAGDARVLAEHCNDISQCRIKLADANAIRFALMELFVLGLVATALVHYCTTGLGLMGGAVQAGDIVAVLGYVLLFLTSLETLPELMPADTRCAIARRFHRRSPR